MINPEQILITGGNSQLGKALQEQYPSAQAVDVQELDITDRIKVEAFDWSSIKVLINAAAYTNVDGAETAKGREVALRVNAEAVANLARIAIENQITLVHISTDYVFDGKKGNHSEDKPFSPLSVYGASKAAGDIAASMVANYYILRTSWVIGDGKNFVRTMLSLGKQGINPTVVADQIGRPTFTSELVRAIDHLVTTESPAGTYNVSNDGEPVSWAAFTRSIFAAANLPNTVKSTTTTEYYDGKEDIAPRPLYSTFDLKKIKETGFKPRDWHEDLDIYVKNEEDNA